MLSHYHFYRGCRANYVNLIFHLPTKSRFSRCGVRFKLLRFKMLNFIRLYSAINSIQTRLLGRPKRPNRFDLAWIGMNRPKHVWRGIEPVWLDLTRILTRPIKVLTEPSRAISWTDSICAVTRFYWVERQAWATHVPS